jgi:hypothetical protein
MIEVKRYDASQQKVWDDFIAKSRADSFLFHRDFMDYHADRFTDCSLLVYRKGKLDALLPGNINGDAFYSHQGLTYGGIILSNATATTDVLGYFETINLFLKDLGVKKVIYKALPYIYQNLPSQEDLYALYRLKAEKIGCNISSTFCHDSKLAFVESRKSGIRKAKNAGIEISETKNFSEFWVILEDNLQRTHGTKPVHSLKEMTLLQKRFPDKISNYICLLNGEAVAGCVLFMMKNVVHVQYISANEQGKMTGALDLLFDYLINDKYCGIRYFDFGQSTEKMGAILNENLIFQKEGFGGRGVTYDIYQYSI